MSRLNQVAAVFLGTLGFLCAGIAASADEGVYDGHPEHLRTSFPAAFFEDSPTQKAQDLFSSALHKQATNDLAGAIKDYEASLHLDDDPAVHWYLGTALQAVGRNEEAKAQFAIEQKMKKAIQVDTYKHGGLRPPNLAPAGNPHLLNMFDPCSEAWYVFHPHFDGYNDLVY